MCVSMCMYVPVQVFFLNIGIINQELYNISTKLISTDENEKHVKYIISHSKFYQACL